MMSSSDHNPSRVSEAKLNPHIFQPQNPSSCGDQQRSTALSADIREAPTESHRKEKTKEADLDVLDENPALRSTITWCAPSASRSNEVLEQSTTQTNSNTDADADTSAPHESDQERRKIWNLRGYDDDGDTDWWFASTAIPLLAATLSPLANVLSIAALVTFWRVDLRDPGDATKILPEFSGRPFKDPQWCYWLNVVTLICGFLGNISLLANFTGRIRYIISLPVTIILWFVSSAVLMGITIAMNIHVPPQRPFETYSQGFWYAVMAAILYLVCCLLLMINMLGYFLGHYPQRFELSDHQRTLILQTMLFFIWLAGGGWMFATIESRGDTNKDWSFVDGLYFCDVTILTVGFGDLTLRNDLGRALIFPYTVGGIIMLGLVISSISKFAAEMSQDNVVRKHFERVRTRTLERTTTNPVEAAKVVNAFSKPAAMRISAPTNARHMQHAISEPSQEETIPGNQDRRHSSIASEDANAKISTLRQRRTTFLAAAKPRQKKVRLLRDERQRFDEMRRIQNATQRFKKYWALSLSVCAFAVLWLIGAVVFWFAERKIQGMSYFQALYFCYVSLLTIGYGDFAPQSNAGRPFFVVWSLIAVPTITLLINDMGSTVIESFKKGTFIAADWTILLRRGIWSDFLERHSKIKKYLTSRKEKRERERRMQEGLAGPIHDDITIIEDHEDGDINGVYRRSTTEMSKKKEDADLRRLVDEFIKDKSIVPSEAALARHLSNAIRRVTKDVLEPEKKYDFEEWAELTRLIQLTGRSASQAQQEEEEDDPLDWDWLGDHSPMMANMSEPEFVMEKLCQMLARNMKIMERKVEEGKREIERLRKFSPKASSTR